MSLLPIVYLGVVFAYLGKAIGAEQEGRSVMGRGKFGACEAVSRFGKFSIEYRIAYLPIFLTIYYIGYI